MVTFDWGALIAVILMVVILIVYRQLDKNNRSLEKIRKFADSVRRDLDSFVEQRTADLRDLETVLKAHDKTSVEILKRLQGSEADLGKRAPELEALQGRLDRYAASMNELDTQAQRLDKNLERLAKETAFVDRVSDRIKASGEQMAVLETSFSQIRQEFADVNQKDLDSVRRQTQETFERETLKYVGLLTSAKTQVEEIKTMVEDLETRQHEVAQEVGDALDQRAQSVLESAEKAFAESARQADDLASVVFVRLEDRIESQAKTSEERLSAEAVQREENVQKVLRKLEDRLVEFQSLMEATEAVVGEKQEALKLQWGQESAQLREDFKAEQAQLLALTAQLKSDLEARVTRLREDFDTEAEQTKQELVQSLQADRSASEALAASVRDELSQAHKAVQLQEQQTVQALENRLREYESTFQYRYEKMEDAEKDLASLEQNLRSSLQAVADRIQADFGSFDQAMAARRDEEKGLVENRLAEINDAVSRLDKELEELKLRAYDNVSEKLAGFEDGFFEDLQKRSAAITQSLEDWQKGYQAQLEELQLQSAQAQESAQRQLTDQIKNKLQEVQTATNQQMERLEHQIQNGHESHSVLVGEIQKSLATVRDQLSLEVNQLETSLSTRFEQDRARAELAVGESVTKLERELEGKIRSLTDELERFQTEFKSGLQHSDSEFSLWQTRIEQRFKDLDADLEEQYRDFKTSLGQRISDLAEEFTQQRDDLVGKSTEDRAALKTDLSALRAGVNDLEAALRTRGQSAIDAFEKEYESLSADLQKKNRDLVADVETKLRDYRNSAADLREKAEAMQKKVFGKIEDQANLLQVNLEEIDKRQKNFISQTKVFERADSLRQELQESMEDLKADLSRVEVQRKDLFEIETGIARIKKLGDETSEKAARFVAEKKRIDLMDTDFQRILGLSQSMELRLEQVSTSHDLLQDIQLRIRKLEDYSKDIEVRYDRLEKRRELLDTTTDGVDRNFSLLERLEKTARSLESELKAMPSEVEELRKRIKTLGQGKDDAERAVEQLQHLDQILKDVEGRIGRLEQAREWIAGVETRLTETKEAAEEQVQTLATISKASNQTGASKAKGSDSEMRQTVLKLARQGWGKEEISRATKLSLGEVELILELGTR